MQEIHPKEAAARLQGFGEFVGQMMQEWKVQGLATAIVQGNDVIFTQGFGMRDSAHDLPVTMQTLFPIASCTKAFTTTALSILADQGKLDWETPIRTYLPEFKLYDTFASERMTPRDLVTHCSGLPRHDLMWYNSSASREELFERLRYLEPTKDFRSFWQYQNLMYMTAGYLIGRISGQSWETFVQQHIFDALGMSRSNFDIIETTKNAEDFSHPYKEDENDEVKEIPFYAAQGAIAPAGAIVSCIDDMSKWLLLHLNKGRFNEQQIVSESQIGMLHSPQVVIPEASQYPEIPYSSYAFGWFIQPYRGYSWIHHGGNIDGFSSLTTLFPRENVGMVVLTNMSGTPIPMILTLNAFERLLDLDQVSWSERFMKEHNELKAGQKQGKEKSESDRIPDTRPSHELSAYTGDFTHSGYGTFTIKLNDAADELHGSFNNMDFPMKHYHYDIFDINVERFEIRLKATFSTNVKGDIDSVSMPLEPTVKDIVFKRVPGKEMMEKSFLEQFTGEYEILGTIMTVSLKGEQALSVSLPGEPDQELVPYKGTEFQAKGLSSLSIDFKLDASGKASEALITMPYGAFTAKRNNSA
jgi:CubicO group peptidase (beta-lactamase class C family)